MADKKITQLTNITGANLAEADEFVVVDITADETKAITFSELKTAFDTGTGFVRVTGDTMTGALNVESTITSDGLTVDGTTGVTISGAYPTIFFGETDTTDLNTRLRTTGGSLNISTVNDAYTGGINRFNLDHSTGDISFYEDTGTTAKFFWDSSSESLGIGQAPTSALHVINSNNTGESIATFEAASAKNGYIYINGDANRRKSLVFQSAGVDKFSMGVGDSDELSESSFFIGNGKTGGSGAKLVIDSSGRVGIGTSSPNASFKTTLSGLFGLRIQSADTNNSALNIGCDTNSGVSFIDSTKTGTGTFLPLRFATNDTERLRITSTGNVGIGTSNPLAKLQIKTQANGNASFQNSTSVAGGVKINAFNDAGSASVPFEIDGSSLQFNIASVEKIRIDASGNLLVGKTGSNLFTVGAELTSTGQVYATASSAPTARFNRKTSDGEIVDFRKDDTTVGSIVVESSKHLVISTPQNAGNLVFEGNDSGGTVTRLAIENTTGSEAFRPYNSYSDNKYNLGSGSRRFKDAYLSGGVYLGGTTSANKLDDYEEGYHQTSFTPSGSGSITLSGAHRYLRYTKIGNHVYISGKVDVSSVSSPAGYIHVSLPFAIDNTSPAGINDSRRFAGTIWVTNASINMTEFTLYGIEGESSVRIYRSDTTTNASTSAQTFSGNEGVAFNFFYATTS